MGSEPWGPAPEASAEFTPSPDCSRRPREAQGPRLLAPNTLSTGTPAREEQHIMLRGFLGPPWRPRRLLSWSRCFSRASPDLSRGHRPQPPLDVSLNPRPFTPPGLQCPSDPSVHSRGPACVPCAPGAGRGSKTRPRLFRRPRGRAAEGPCNQRALERSVSGVRENGARRAMRGEASGPRVHSVHRSRG